MHSSRRSGPDRLRRASVGEPVSIRTVFSPAAPLVPAWLNGRLASIGSSRDFPVSGFMRTANGWSKPRGSWNGRSPTGRPGPAGRIVMIARVSLIRSGPARFCPELASSPPDRPYFSFGTFPGPVTICKPPLLRGRESQRKQLFVLCSGQTEPKVPFPLPRISSLDCPHDHPCRSRR